MYAPTQQPQSMAPPQKPETFMLSSEAQQSLPQDAQVALQQVDNLKYFLISAPVDWTPDQYIRRFLLPTGEYVSCVLWNNLFHISGTDIVRCLSFRFQAFGRPVKNTKKFEEGIFSDLRNLKSGTDASLEEPKSPFLDFLYKNNCIRTQKKQKVFYWYSVPHDRLFLDALERDLKREKMNQEATTMAVNEPALSFEFDSSQSLFEQLTKAQQANTSSFAANAPTAYSQSASPVMRAADSMPPPAMMPQQMGPMPDQVSQMAAFTQGAAAPSAAAHAVAKAGGDFGSMQYDRNGVPLQRPHQRHASMPAYMEYSPAPSFVSSQYEDYSNRGVSFEPVTPPSQSQNMGGEPAYISNEESGLYSSIPDSGQGYQPMMNMAPSGMSGMPYQSNQRNYNNNNNGMYSVIEGSPTYKQRRRRSSIPSSVTAAVAAAAANNGMQHAPHRQSDLRRSISVSVPPVPEGQEVEPDSAGAVQSGYHSAMDQHKQMMEMSRNGSPMPTLEGNNGMPGNEFPIFDGQEGHDSLTSPNRQAGADRSAGAFRRARSATMMELGPYPQKSHSCPIPSCGRLFKRLEHLKRHVRTHTQERPYVCPNCNKAFSRSDNLAQHRRIHEPRADGEPVQIDEEEGENEGDDFQSGESPTQMHGNPTSAGGLSTGGNDGSAGFGQQMSNMGNMNSGMGMMNGMSGMNTPSQLIQQQQMLQGQI